MIKAELMSAVAAKVETHSLTNKQINAVVDAVFATLSEVLCSEGGFSYNGFGTFKVKSRGARNGRNPRTGEPIKISACKSVSFKAAPKLKVALNGEEAVEEPVVEKVVEAKKECKKSCKKTEKKADDKKATKKTKK